MTRDIENIIKNIINGGKLDYNDNGWAIDSSPEHIKKKGSFDRNDKYIKALLCVYAHKEPSDFDDGSKVAIKNEYFNKSNCPNCHHFFPSSFMEKNGQKDNPYVNHILNITFIRAGLNGDISDKDPRKYVDQYKGEVVKATNGKLEIGDVMKTHLIGDGSEKSLSKWGVLGKGNLGKQFDTFIEKRAELLSKEIEALIK